MTTQEKLINLKVTVPNLETVEALSPHASVGVKDINQYSKFFP